MVSVFIIVFLVCDKIVGMIDMEKCQIKCLMKQSYKILDTEYSSTVADINFYFSKLERQWNKNH